MTYRRGDSRSFIFEKSESLLHDLENIGDAVLSFVTVELLRGANEPLAASSPLDLGRRAG